MLQDIKQTMTLQLTLSLAPPPLTGKLVSIFHKYFGENYHVIKMNCDPFH